jgi:hypothetical protein
MSRHAYPYSGFPGGGPLLPGPHKIFPWGGPLLPGGPHKIFP